MRRTHDGHRLHLSARRLAGPVAAPIAIDRRATFEPILPKPHSHCRSVRTSARPAPPNVLRYDAEKLECIAVIAHLHVSLGAQHSGRSAADNRRAFEQAAATRNTICDARRTYCRIGCRIIRAFSAATIARLSAAVHHHSGCCRQLLASGGGAESSSADIHKHVFTRARSQALVGGSFRLAIQSV